jgi:hypothetical protein
VFDVFDVGIRRAGLEIGGRARPGRCPIEVRPGPRGPTEADVGVRADICVRKS